MLEKLKTVTARKTGEVLPNEYGRKMSRREFIERLSKAAAGGAAALAGGAFIDSLTGGKVKEKVLDKSVDAFEVAQSLVESRRDHESDEISIEGRESVLDDGKIRIERLSVAIENKDESLEPVLVTFSEDSECALVPVPTGKREDLLENGDSDSILYGPVGYIEGEYQRSQRAPHWDAPMKFKLAGRTSEGLTLGPDHIVDRFPGLSEELNGASGGLTFINNKIEIVDKNQLGNALSSGDAFVQMVFYIDDQNKESVLGSEWNHWGSELKIGDTAYSWGAYIQYPEKGKVKTGYLVVDKEQAPISYLVKTAEALSDNGTFKMALADAGNGSSIVGKSSGAESKFAYGTNGFNTHLTPAVVEIK